MKRSLKILGCFIIICALGIYYSTISNAAIEIKPGTTPHTSITVSTSYQYCYDMRSSTSTLGVNSLDPHLTLNADWGAVAYLGASTYGNVRDKNGTSVTIEEKTYYSTTNNITGVINMSYNMHTQTSSLISTYSSSNANITKLANNINTKYVEKIELEGKTQGLALVETAGWLNSEKYYPTAERPVGIRSSIFGINSFDGFANGFDGYYTFCGDGGSYGKTTYRPVIWN